MRVSPGACASAIAASDRTRTASTRNRAFLCAGVVIGPPVDHFAPEYIMPRTNGYDPAVLTDEGGSHDCVTYLKVDVLRRFGRARRRLRKSRARPRRRWRRTAAARCEEDAIAAGGNGGPSQDFRRF